MSDLDTAASRVSQWLQPLTGADGPCGPDLEYDNAFLALTQAASGKPETQFAAAEPADWPAVVEQAEALLDRSRDLRVAVLWLRGLTHQAGIGAVAPGLTLVAGLLETCWDQIHPLPDPDDGDPYARVNALTVLRENEGFIGDLRQATVIDDRSIGQLTVRAFELARDLASPAADETKPNPGQLEQMLAAAIARQPALRQASADGVAALRRLVTVAQDKLGDDAPDFRPLRLLLDAVDQAMPAAASEDDASSSEESAGEAAPGAAPRQNLSGRVNSREDAVRAIDLVCEYLDSHEPANPAPLFLRRARQLINCNFLQLMKALAPESLSGVANLVGVDPEAVESPPP